MDKTAARARVTRMLAVLALALGLLAMHGLASTHHAAAAAPLQDAPHGPVHAAPHAAALAPAQHAPAGHVSAPLPLASPALAAPPGPRCDDDCQALTAVCLAVLTGVVLALLVARLAPGRLAPLPARSLARASTPPLRHARGPDPVRELCVSRT